MTVHRQQGATSNRAHVFADGGGRELAYVALSRARHRSTIHATADNLEQAVEDLRHDWSQSQAQRWVSRTHQPGTDHRLQPATASRLSREERRASLLAELETLQHAERPDNSRRIRLIETELDLLAAQDTLDAVQVDAATEAPTPVPGTRPAVPLINNAGATLRWFIEDVWGHFDDDHARPGAPLFPSERHNADGSSARVSAEALRAALAEAACRYLPGWSDKLTPHVLRHFCASQLYGHGMDLIAIQETLGHVWVATTMNYIHVQRTHIEDAWTAGQQRAAERLKGLRQ